MPRLSRKRNLRGKKKKSFRKNYSKSKRRVVKKRISKRKRKMRGGADFSLLQQTRCNLTPDGPAKIACLTQVIKSKLESAKDCHSNINNCIKQKINSLNKDQKNLIKSNGGIRFHIRGKEYYYDGEYGVDPGVYGGFETEIIKQANAAPPPEETFEGFEGR